MRSPNQHNQLQKLNWLRKTGKMRSYNTRFMATELHMRLKILAAQRKLSLEMMLNVVLEIGLDVVEGKRGEER